MNLIIDLVPLKEIGPMRWRFAHYGGLFDDAAKVLNANPESAVEVDMAKIGKNGYARLAQSLAHARRRANKHKDLFLMKRKERVWIYKRKEAV